MFKPRDYQVSGVESILEKFQTHQRILYQLSTGGGKTFCFTMLSKKWSEEKKQKVLVLCHRNELVEQTI